MPSPKEWIVAATQQIRRIVFALLISVVLNGFLLAVAFSVDPRQRHQSDTANIANALLKPAGALTAQFVPGHGGEQPVMLFVFSVFFYAVAAWAVLSLPGWWRHRT
jgi:cbb3-type cytochrome oxidase subunit 3